KEDSVLVTENGRPARLTYYTVELDTARPVLTPGSAQVASPQLGSALQATPGAISGESTRSDLVFSVLVYADNSVSMRAKLHNPPNRVGYAPSNFELHERLRLRNTGGDRVSLATQFASTQFASTIA